jgi:signal transduction histidine kinase
MTGKAQPFVGMEWSSAEWIGGSGGERTSVRIVSVLAIAGVYFASAKMGLSLAFVAEQVSVVWPPTGIALAAILVLGFWTWPGILLGAFLANATANEPILVAGGIAIGNTLEAVIGAWLLRRVVGFDNTLERVRDAIGLILLAASISTMMSATIGVTSLILGRENLPAMHRVIAWSDFGALWRIWWLGDAMGTLVVAPPLLTWVTSRNKSFLHRPVEVAALFVGLLATCWLAFLGRVNAGLSETSLTYVVFPFVIWAALRFSQPVTTGVTLVASTATIWAAIHGTGPFGGGTVHERLLSLQAFMIIVATTALVLGAALAERKRAEQTLKDVDRRKDEFLATLAHELRNPLAPIQTGIDLIRLSDVPDLETREIVDMIGRQLQQLIRLVDDLLDVSRVTRGKIRLHLELVNLSTIVERAIETVQPLMHLRGHRLMVPQAKQQLQVKADATRLTQVFANLLNNAAKHSDEAGCITLGVAQEGHMAVVRVRDEGHGIEHDLLPQIFDLFVQGDRTLTRSEGGLGIGLTLVRSLVEMHGGSVQVISEGPGKGSEFAVHLPLASAASEVIRDQSPALQRESSKPR